jgi:hypothetical protein
MQKYIFLRITKAKLFFSTLFYKYLTNIFTQYSSNYTTDISHHQEKSKTKSPKKIPPLNQPS